MEDRKQAILRAVVHEFTTSAVPVGSQALQSRYFVNLSSATIRSELAELADQGYLTQPHTSAGRVPTDSGYRYFVDFLMDLEPVPDRVRAYIKDEMRAAPADVQGMVERVAMTVASVTQNASVASAPQGALARIKHVDLYEKGSESLVVHDGVRTLLRQPEFAESSRLHQVLEVLEETRYLTVLLRQLIGESDLQIVIGSENASSQLQGCAVVLTTYGPSDRLKGVLGVIGPTRMAYSQTVARLQAVARGASDRMAELGV